jgi:galactose mutarotase-like enzyme
MQIEKYAIGQTSCSIAVNFGCNLYSWHVNGREVLYAPPGFPGSEHRPFDGGNPILFPSVGRTWWRKSPEPLADTYFLAGRKEPLSMPLHGLLASAGWRKVAEQIDGARIHLKYAAEFPESIRNTHYPFQVELRQAFTLDESSLHLEATCTNRGSEPAPFAFGYHPYFRVDPKSRITVELPCASALELDPELLVPTGVESPAEMPMKIDPDRVLDNVFAKPSGPGKHSRAILIDLLSRTQIRIDCDGSIGYFVIYHPAGAEYLCLEPWTRGLGQYEALAEEGWQKSTALLILQPGQERRISVRYTVSTVAGT